LNTWAFDVMKCRITIKVRIIYMLVVIAVSLLKTEDSIATPCSVKA